MSAELLEQLDMKLSVVRARTRSVALGYNTGFFLFGPGGSGKTFAVRGELETLDVPWTLHNSSMTAAGMFETLYDKPNDIHLLEDMEQVYSDKTAVGYLRSACWGDANMRKRYVTKTTAKKRISFEFRGGIIILSNLPLGDCGHLRALGTRLNPAEFVPTEEEKAALMVRIASKGKLGLSPEACLEVCEFILEFTNGRPLDLRLLDNSIGDRLMYDRRQSPVHWRDLVASRIEGSIEIPKHSRAERVQAEREIAKRIFEQFSDRAERAKAWQEETGKSERALYRRGEEVGVWK
ncbi:MAG: hypothetical protein K2X38_13270 [Gemmataceae bacterium]|nr:hypothetical protein [Gemmataceae bacterium]